MKYFAYGSNMLEKQLRHASRSPTALHVGIAVARGRTLRFHKIGRDGSGKCNLAASPDPDGQVYGVLYEIDPSEISALDAVELGYSRTTILVESIDSGGAVEAETFIANPEYLDASIVPFEWYKAVVIAGALEHGLPEQYINKLRECPSKRDPDVTRRDRALMALGGYLDAFETGHLTQTGPGHVDELT